MAHPAQISPQNVDTYFFTVRLKDPSRDLLTRHVELLRLSVRLCQIKHPFVIDDAVILPDRLHMIWTLPEDDRDFARRWSVIKSTFVRHLPPRAVGRGGGIWQRRFWEQPITSAQDLAESVSLIRMAPVVAGLVDAPDDWPFSKRGRVLSPGRSDVTRSLRLVQGGLAG